MARSNERTIDWMQLDERPMVFVGPSVFTVVFESGEIFGFKSPTSVSWESADRVDRGSPLSGLRLLLDDQTAAEELIEHEEMTGSLVTALLHAYQGHFMRGLDREELQRSFQEFQFVCQIPLEASDRERLGVR